MSPISIASSPELNVHQITIRDKPEQLPPRSRLTTERTRLSKHAPTDPGQQSPLYEHTDGHLGMHNDDDDDEQELGDGSQRHNARRLSDLSDIASGVFQAAGSPVKQGLGKIKDKFGDLMLDVQAIRDASRNEKDLELVITDKQSYRLPFRSSELITVIDPINGNGQTIREQRQNRQLKATRRSGEPVPTHKQSYTLPFSSSESNTALNLINGNGQTIREQRQNRQLKGTKRRADAAARSDRLSLSAKTKLITFLASMCIKDKKNLSKILTQGAFLGIRVWSAGGLGPFLIRLATEKASELVKEKSRSRVSGRRTVGSGA